MGNYSLFIYTFICVCVIVCVCDSMCVWALVCVHIYIYTGINIRMHCMSMYVHVLYT